MFSGSRGSNLMFVLFVLCVFVEMPVFADHASGAQIPANAALDEIQPLNQPQYDAVSTTTWLKAEDWVIGFEHNDDARAYPIKIMNWHEIVNDTVGQLDVVITYCPLCRSAVVFDRNLDRASLSEAAVLPADTALSFGNTGALYESDLVMYDKQTNSDWYQLGGEAIRGPLHGTRLKRLPVQMMTWAQWQRLYPEGKVLSRDTGFPSYDYDQDSYEAMNRYERTRPPDFRVSALDERAEPRAHVLGLSLNGISKAYEIDLYDDDAYADQFGDQPVVLFVQNHAAVAYSPVVGNARLTFAYRGGNFFDIQTNSTWNLAGKAIGGKLRGRQLRALPQTQAFWFSWALHRPQTELISDASMMNPYKSPSAQPKWGLTGIAISFVLVVSAMFLSLRFIINRTIRNVVLTLGWMLSAVALNAYAETRMTVFAGFAGNVVVQQTLTPVRVQLQHNGPPLVGQLVLSQTVETPWRGTFTENLVVPIRLGQRANKTFKLYFPLTSIVYPLQVRLESPAGDVLLEQTLDFRDDGQSAPIVVALSETKFPKELPSGETVYTLSVAELPERLEGFESFKRLYLGRFDLSVLKDEQQQALLHWIMLGGELILLTGENWYVQDGPLLRPWLPLAPDRVTTFTRETGETIELLSGTVQGDVVYAVEGRPWVLVRPVGQGRVWMTTVNPFSTDVPDSFWQALRPAQDFKNEESFEQVARVAFDQHILKHPSRTLLAGLIFAFVAGVALWSFFAMRKPWGIAALLLWVGVASGGILLVLHQPQYVKLLTAAEFGVERTLPDGTAIQRAWFGVYAQRKEDVSLLFPSAATTRQLLPNERGDHLFDLDYALGEKNEVRFTSGAQQIRALLNVTQSNPKLLWSLDQENNLLQLQWTGAVLPEYAWLWHEGAFYELDALEAAPARLQLDQLQKIRLAERLPIQVVKLWEWAVGAERATTVLGAWHRQDFSPSLRGTGKRVYHLVISGVPL